MPVYLVDVRLFDKVVVFFGLLQARFHVSCDLSRIKFNLAHLLLEEVRSVPHLPILSLVEF